MVALCFLTKSVIYLWRCKSNCYASSRRKSIRPVGAQREEPIDVRIISASHRDLDAMVREGGFRQDLYYRINVIGVTVPNLAERSSDIALLVQFLIERHNQQNSNNVEISQAALDALLNYDYPGNVRELENILERALALCENDSIEVDDLQLPDGDRSEKPDQTNLHEMTQNLEKTQIIDALESNRWNQSATARALGLTLRQLRYRIDKLQLKKS